VTNLAVCHEKLQISSVLLAQARPMMINGCTFTPQVGVKLGVSNCWTGIWNGRWMYTL